MPLSTIASKDRLIVALDLPGVDQAETMIARLGDSVTFYKIGYQLAYAGGLSLVGPLTASGKKVFVDLKLHDIGNTVARGVESLSSLGATFLTVHAYPQTMQAAVDQNTFSQRLGLYLVGSFAGLAIAMVFAGLYGVLSQLVSYRRREIGVRMALGATRTSVAQLVLRQGSVLVGVGLVVGLLLAVAAGRLVKSFLYQVQPVDLWTYLSVALALTLIGLMAALLPARRAASIEPMQALRED